MAPSQSMRVVFLRRALGLTWAVFSIQISPFAKMYRSANLVTSAQCGTGETTKGRILFLRRHYPDQVQGTGGSLIPLHLSRTCVQRPCIRFVLRSDSFYLTGRGLSRNGGQGGAPPPFFLLHFSLLLIKPSPGGRWSEGPDEGEPCGVVLHLVSLSSCDVKGRGRRFKTRFFFPAGKRTVFGIQRKRGYQAG